MLVSGTSVRLSRRNVAASFTLFCIFYFTAVMQGRRKSLKVGGAWGGGLGAEPPVGGQGGKAPPEADEVFVFKTLIFNASAIVLHEMTHCLSCFFWAHVYVFTVRICSPPLQDSI